MKKLKQNDVLVLMLFVFIYKFTLDYIYIHYITKYQSSIGFIYDFNTQRYIITNIIILISVFPLKKMFDHFQKPSAMMMITFYLVYFYPNCIFHSVSNSDSGFFYFSITYWAVLTLIYFIISKNKNTLKQRFRSYDPFYFYSLLFSVVIIAVSFTIYYNGFKLKFNLSNIYEIRTEVKSMDVAGIFGYVKPLASKFSQIGLIFFLINKKRSMVALFVVFQLMFFAFGAHKTDFFFLIITFVIYSFYNDKLKHFLLYGLILLNIITIFIFSKNKLLLIEVTAILTRVLFTPSVLSSYFFDFFSTNEFLYLREHFNRFIGLDNPYGMETPYLIARTYRNAYQMQANTGLIGTDFAQFGWASLFLLIPVRMMLMKLMDKVSSGLDVRITILVSFSFAFIFTNGSLMGTLLTGGYLMVALLLYIMPRVK